MTNPPPRQKKVFEIDRHFQSRDNFASLLATNLGGNGIAWRPDSVSPIFSCHGNNRPQSQFLIASLHEEKAKKNYLFSLSTIDEKTKGR